jgi:hypothetical protein
MPNKPVIRWGKNDTESITNTIKKFNAKIYRERRKHPETKELLPDTIKKADKQKMIEELKQMPRSEFKKTIKSLDRFNKKGAEQIITSETGNKVTKWEKNEVSIMTGTLNRQRARMRKEVENMEATSRGERLGMKRGEMGSERMNALKPKKFNFNKIKGGKEWELFKEGLKRQTISTAKDIKREQYKRNYITSAEMVFGEHGRDLINMLEEIPAELIEEKYYSEQEATIEFQYSPEEMQIKLDIVTKIWTPVYEKLKKGGSND